MKKILVTGSSGFIGGHLVRYLKEQGHYVVGADIVQPLYTKPSVFYNCDLRSQGETKKVFSSEGEFDEIYNLACLMGGMGFIGDTKWSYNIMVGSTQIVANILDWSASSKRTKHFYSSSACVYNMNLQEQTNVSLKEADAFPSMPDLMYGWQKLQSELMYKAANEQWGTPIRIARFHNIFGEEGTWDGGKEKYPAAICRKVTKAENGDTISIWGDGLQTRSFLHVSECIEGIMKLMESDCIEPLNIGSDELVSVNEVADMVIKLSGKDLKIEHDLTKPQGVRGRNSNNELIYQKLGWKPETKLIDGLRSTYNWINKQVNND
jgi:nucleoside-diphosphate-sugar epimerase